MNAYDLFHTNDYFIICRHLCKEKSKSTDVFLIQHIYDIISLLIDINDRYPKEIDMSTMLRLKYFVSLADNLSFTKAARECYIVQTAMSRQIAALESELGVQLFIRNTRSVELTEAGREFYSYAVNALDNYTKGIERAKKIAKDYDSTLKIGIGPQEHPLLEPLLKQFMEKYPQSSVIVEQLEYRDLQRKFREGSYTTIIAHRKRLPDFEDAKTIEFPGIKWGLILSRDNPLSKNKSLSLDDLDGQTFVTMTSVNMDEFEAAVLEKNPSSRFITANSIQLKNLFVRINMAVAFIPGFLASEMPEGVVFKEFEEGTQALRDVEFDFVYREEPTDSLAQRAFISMTRDYLKGSGKFPWT